MSITESRGCYVILLEQKHKKSCFNQNQLFAALTSKCLEVLISICFGFWSRSKPRHTAMAVYWTLWIKQKFEVIFSWAWPRKCSNIKDEHLLLQTASLWQKPPYTSQNYIHSKGSVWGRAVEGFINIFNLKTCIIQYNQLTMFQAPLHRAYWDCTCWSFYSPQARLFYTDNVGKFSTHKNYHLETNGSWFQITVDKSHAQFHREQD